MSEKFPIKSYTYSRLWLKEVNAQNELSGGNWTNPLIHFAFCSSQNPLILALYTHTQSSWFQQSTAESRDPHSMPALDCQPRIY